MPIRRENKDLYPPDWREISNRIRWERANNRCESCGVEGMALGGRAPDGTFHRAKPNGTDGLDISYPKPGDYEWCEGYDAGRLRVVRIILTVAHLDHNPRNNNDSNLRALCQRCHNRYDAKMRRAGRRARALQMEMFP